MNSTNNNFNSSNENIKGDAHLKTDWETQKIAQLAIVKALQSANPHLVPVGEFGTRITATKNIRIELKRRFPKVKFSIKSESFAGGDAIRVGWTDGPTNEEVEQTTSKYSAGSFDGSQDLYNYENTIWTKAFGDAKYVTESRDYSPEAVQQTLNEIAETFHDGEIPTAEQYKKGELFNTTPSRHCESWQHLLYRAIRTKSL